MSFIIAFCECKLMMVSFGFVFIVIYVIAHTENK
jgi:hypothetical protein